MARPTFPRRVVPAAGRVWAQTGECRSNFEWMSVHCPMACGVCGVGTCADLEEECSTWASSNSSECETNARFMIERCPASCDACPTLRKAAMECDACLALQEATWRHLAYTHSEEPDNFDGHHHVWNHPAGLQAIRVALRDLCSSHEWFSLGASLDYHAWCESTVSTQLERMAASWAMELSSSQGALLDRATALRQKTAVCVARPPEGIGACDERELRLLRLGVPTSAGSCSACRTFVGDAVTIFRRSGQTPSDPVGSAFRVASRLLDDICDDLDMRHFAAEGTPASALYEDCSELVRANYDLLVKLVHQWTFTDVEHYVCSRMLGLCMQENEVPGHASSRLDITSFTRLLKPPHPAPALVLAWRPRAHDQKQRTTLRPVSHEAQHARLPLRMATSPSPPSPGGRRSPRARTRRARRAGKRRERSGTPTDGGSGHAAGRGGAQGRGAPRSFGGAQLRETGP